MGSALYDARFFAPLSTFGQERHRLYRAQGQANAGVLVTHTSAPGPIECRPRLSGYGIGDGDRREGNPHNYSHGIVTGSVVGARGRSDEGLFPLR